MDIISKDVLGKMVHEQYIVDDYVKMSNILIHIHCICRLSSLVKFFMTVGCLIHNLTCLLTYILCVTQKMMGFFPRVMSKALDINDFITPQLNNTI